MFDGSECISRKIALTGVDKFLSRRSTFRGMQKIGGQNQIIRAIKTQLEIFLFVLYYLNRIAAFILTRLQSKVFAVKLLSSECYFNV